MLTDANVQVGRLQVSGAAGVASQVAGALSRNDAGWPLAADWIFVRSITARARACAIAGEVAAGARHAVAAAVPVGNPGWETAGAIRFAGLADVLARLALDLAAGSQRWCWAQWQHLFRQPRAEALTGLLTEHLDYLPAVTVLLARNQRLAEVWRVIAAPGARALLGKYAARGLAVPPGAERAGSPRQPFDARRQERAGYRSEVEAAGQVRAADTLMRLEAGTVARWRPVAADLRPASDPLRLVMLLAALEVMPQRLAAGLLDVDDWQALAAQLGSAPLPARQRAPYLLAPDGARQQLPSNRARKRMPSPGAPAAVRPTVWMRPRADSTASSSSVRDDEAQIRVARGADSVRTEISSVGARRAAGQSGDATAVVPVEAPHQASVAASMSESSVFLTDFGGLFFLLAALSAAALEDWRRAAAHRSAWHWLARLGLGLGLKLDDPLAQFLAIRMQRDDLRDLEPLPDEQVLLEFLAAALGELWGAHLIGVPACIACTPSHVDIHLRLDDLDVRIRLAGLDLNPGWVPWLGRVVTFHYDAELPAGQNDG